MRPILAVLTALCLAWSCHAVEPYDTLRILANWEWQLVDIDDPGDADLLVFPETPDGAVPLIEVASKLHAEWDSLGQRVKTRARSTPRWTFHFDLTEAHFPLSEATSANNDNVQWILEIERPNLELVDQLIEQGPWSKPPKEPRDAVSDFFFLGEVLEYSQRALNRALATGDFHSAKLDLERSQKIAYRLANLEAPNCMDQGLLACYSSRTHDEHVTFALKFLPLTEELRDTLTDLRTSKTPLGLDLLHRAFRGEHLETRIDIDKIVNDPNFPNVSAIRALKRKQHYRATVTALSQLPATFTLQRNRTLQASASNLRKAITLAKGSPHQALRNLEDLRDSTFRNRWKPPLHHQFLNAVNGNGLGEILLTEYQSIWLLHYSFFEAMVSHDLTQLALAIRLYQLDHARALPWTLEDLAPMYIDALPVDPFSNQPYQFKVDDGQFVLWSVGMDEEDQNGELSQHVIDDYLADYKKRSTPPPLPALWIEDDITLRLPIIPAPYP